MMVEVFWTTVAALLTLAIFSFLYEDNPFYKFAEHIYVGSSAAFMFIYVLYFDLWPKLWTPFFSKLFHGDWGAITASQWWLIVPTILSVMMLTRLLGHVAPQLMWISRWPIAFTVGVGSGLGITGTLQGILVPQINATFLPLWTSSMLHTFNNWIIVFGTLTTLAYFYFSVEHKGVLGGMARVGIVFIMVGFGASFGYTVMARVSLLIGRVYFLVHNWLHLV